MTGLAAVNIPKTPMVCSLNTYDELYALIHLL